MIPVYTNLIGGKPHASSKELYFKVFNPASSEAVAQVSDADISDMVSAVEAAFNAFSLWSNSTAHHRSRVLRKLFELVHAHKDEIARTITLEQGKPLNEALTEVDYGASFIEWYAEEAKRIEGDVMQSPNANNRIVVLRQAVGVVGIIAPWNFPLAMITRKMAAALAAGCTVVIKPSEETPLTALLLGRLALEAGLNKGEVNVVCAANPKEIVEAMIAHPRLAKISFTGSTEVGKLLMRQAADGVKKVSLELGGNAPFIVFEDASVSDAIKGYLANKFRNAGQTCICANRVLVHEKVKDVFVNGLSHALTSLTVGDGFHPDTTIGPLINKEACDKVEALMEDAIGNGATLLLGKTKRKPGTLFFEPVLLDNVSPEMQLYRTEIFGPVTSILSFNSDEEAIKMANDTDYGLAAYIYTKDLSRAWRVSEQLEYGMVGVNETKISNEIAPFGGIKQSGIGREGGRYGLNEFLQIKYLCLNV